ncbi:SMC family ATPase [Geomonas sp. RF6]|uniref:AAA family ATPase n=1 Tax=Geomonas sp. RF6 TaxID=2897342 RepID=UPI001E39340D|nr:SMC family ATPase [Geomonas sp. RF6]UFS69847.1 SMC family ATPase [Geomonas sp. RF6]
MLILSLELKNIKSHRDTVLSFSAGINVLCGPNGVGKSTIFEAIGYCLFGVNAQDFVSRAERFLSIGAKKGEISVVFQPADGELYRATRTVGAAAKWLLAKKVGDVFEVEDHANLQETEARIATLLGLNNGRPLADQFKLVIGPFQNDFLGPFVIKQPTKRQDAFDEILGIDAWRKTFDGTKTLMSAIQAKAETLKAEVAGREEQVAALPAKLAEASAVRDGEAARRAELASQNAGLEKISAELATLDEEKRKLDLSVGELKGVEERIASGKDHVAAQQLLVEQSRAAAAATAEAAAGKESYDFAEERLKTLRQEEQAKLQLERQGAALEKEISTLAGRLEIERREQLESAQQIEQDAARLSEEETAVATRSAALKTEGEECRRRLAEAQQVAADFRLLPLHQVERAVPYLFASLDRLEAIAVEVREKGKLLETEGDVRSRAERLPALKEELKKVHAERAELQGRKLSLVEGREKLASGQCPYFHEACQNLSSNGGADLEARLDLLDGKMAELDAGAREVAAALAEAESAEKELLSLQKVRADLQRLAADQEKAELDFSRALQPVAPEGLVAAAAVWGTASGIPADLLQLQTALQLTLPETVAERRREVEEWRTRVHHLVASLQEALSARLVSAEEPVQRCERQEVELRAKGDELKRAQEELAARRKRLEARGDAISEQEKKLESQRGVHVAVKESLSRYDGVDAGIAAAEADLAKFREARDSYIANQKAAEELPKREDTLAKYQDRLAALERERVARSQEIQTLQGAYCADRHEAARGSREILVTRIATLSAELVSLAESARRLEGEVALLTALAQEVEKKKGAIDELNEQGALVKFLRNQVFKNVSAQLSERFREEISFRADRIYRNIAESDEELYWGENYQVVLKDLVEGSVRERTDDQLSGGQMMSAVVALRLALLQTIGARVAFFDEPTSNLDADRRENLARAFRAIDVGQEEVTEHWYDQLFLVSHDVSFTEITDQMIQLGEKNL